MDLSSPAGSAPSSTEPEAAQEPNTATSVSPEVHVRGWLRLIERRVLRAIGLRTSQGEESDPIRNLFVSEETLVRLFTSPPSPLEPTANEIELLEQVWAQEQAGAGDALPLQRLREVFGLNQFDVEALMVVAAPDLDARFEQFYGYLNEDPGLRQATVGLTLRLCGQDVLSDARSRLLHGPLAGDGLIMLEEQHRSTLTQTLRISDDAVAFLLGHPVPPAPGLRPSSAPAALSASAQATAERLAPLVRRGHPLYLRGWSGSNTADIARYTLQLAGTPATEVDVADLTGDGTASEVATMLRQARMCGRAILVHAADQYSSPTEHTASKALQTAMKAPCPVVLTGQAVWQRAWSPVVPVTVDCPPMPRTERHALWDKLLPSTLPERVATLDTLTDYHLDADDIRAAAAHPQASYDPSVLTAAARAYTAHELQTLAQRVDPQLGWEDLILPTAALQQLQDLVHRIHHRDTVHHTWNMQPGAGRGDGVSALFSGESGTGKTLAAEVLATALNTDLYIIDLATVIDKYIGETEKNLERIFTQAENVNAVLLFDEADAIFGKRSDTKDAHDRYANTETSYLLHRIETFNGVALLTTNLRSNIDEAFQRRLDAIIHFPRPTPALRHQLWNHCLGPHIPRDPNLDLDHLANAFDLTGGTIRACAVTAAYRCAHTLHPLTNDDLNQAIRTEYSKEGRLIDPTNFTPKHPTPTPHTQASPDRQGL